MQAVRVRRKRWNGKIFFAGVGIEFVGEWIKSDQAAVALSPYVFFSLKNTKVMRDLPVAHVKGAHEGPEVASRIGREVAHQSTTLVPSVRGFMGFTDEAEEPQAGSSGRQSQSLVGGGDHEFGTKLNAPGTKAPAFGLSGIECGWTGACKRVCR